MRRAMIPAAFTAAAVVVLVFGWRLTSAVGPDVNNDGFVSIGDISQTVRAFGQTVPTPPPIIGNRAFGCLTPPDDLCLMDTSDGHVIASYPGFIYQLLPEDSSCTGDLVLLWRPLGSPTNSTEIKFVDTVTGDVLAAFTHAESSGSPNKVLIPCALKAHMGGTLQGGVPATGRAAIVMSGPLAVAYIVDLEAGSILSSYAASSDASLNCANDTLAFDGKLIDLNTGTVVASPGTIAPVPC